MARKAEPSISYYRMNCNHVHNRKIKLLFNEFDASGYWIWQCILSTAYGTTGYYFDCNDHDSLVLFASDVCKKPVSLVKEVIAGCVRRDLFDKDVFDMFGVLTSEMMQEDYLIATSERRKKTSVIELKEDYLLIRVSASERNIVITPGKNSIPPVNNPITLGSSTQSRVEYSRGEKMREDLYARDEDLENSILNFFGFNQLAHHDKARKVLAFCTALFNSNQLEHFKIQFQNYQEFKKLNNGYRHSFQNFLGDQEECFENGAWNAENWEFKLNEEKEKSSGKKEKGEQRLPVKGVEAALQFANVTMR